MYTLGSTEFNQIIETPNNQSVKKRLVLLDNGTIIDKIKSLTLYSSSSSQELQLGTTNMAYIEAEVDSDLLLTNREVRLECGVTLSDGSEEYIPMGIFTIQKPQGDIDFVKFKAHDNMQKFEKMYVSALDYPTTSNLVLDEICNMCGVVLSTPIENPIEITEKLQGYTCREVLGFIAGIHGKFACIDRLGTLNLRWYSETPIDKQIGLIWAFNKSDDDFTVDKIEIAKDTETNYISGSGFSAIYHSNPLATQEIADDLFAKLNGFTYNASTIDILDDIRLDIWDVIKVIYLDGKEYLVICMSLKQDFGQGSTSIQSFAKTNTENEYRYNGAMTNYVNRIAMELLLTNRIVATKVDAEYVNSVAITTENFEAKVAEIKELVVEEIDGKYATIDFANIDVANINKTNIGLLFAEVGLLDRATIVDGHVTGFLDAVEINANKITAGTLIADRLLLRGSEQSILYQLNSLSRNLIPYPYVTTNKTLNGITWTVNDDGTITVNGTATAVSYFFLDATSSLSAGTYTISGCPSGGGSGKYFIRVRDYTDEGNITTIANDYGSGGTFTLTKDTPKRIYISIEKGVTVNNLTFKPMLCEGAEVLPYEPYRERTQALTSETINGEVLTDRTITADKIIANSITANELDVNQIFGNEAVLNKIVSQDIFSNAVATNRVVVGKADRDEIVAENLLEFPYYERTKTQNGITFTVNTDGIVTTNGTASALSQFYFNSDTPLDLKPNTTYTLSGCPSGGSTSTYRMRIIINYRLDGQVQYSDIGNGVTFTTPSNYQHCRIMIDITSGVTVNNLIFKPMLEVGSIAHPYTEYRKGGTGLANNIYYQGTTLIDGGKIYTGTVTADAIATDAIKSKNYVANTSGSFLNLADGSFDSKYLKWNANGIDILSEGANNITLFASSKQYSLNLTTGQVITELSNKTGNENIKLQSGKIYISDLLKIDANAFTYAGKDVFGFTKDGVYTPYLSVDQIVVNGDIGCKSFNSIGMINATGNIASKNDIYANYGLDTQVSLLGLNDRVNYLQPHGYSLIRYTDIGELTTTQKIYTLFNNRKMSDYGMLLITIGVSATDIRATMYVPTLVFSGADASPRTLYLDCFTDNGTVFNQVRIDYVSDTQIKAKLATSTTKTKYLNIYGVKVDAGLSGRSVDLI